MSYQVSFLMSSGPTHSQIMTFGLLYLGMKMGGDGTSFVIRYLSL